MPEVLSVSQFVEKINESLKSFRKFKVEGEVTDFSISRNKWVGFDLKDEEDEQVLNCFTSYGLFRKKMGLEDVLEEGMRVQIKGDPKLRQRGDLSVFCKKIELTGEGTLKKAYEKLKQKLKEEGLFREERKRSLPEFPQRIGLITSKEARAFTDFIKGLKERRGGLDIYHASVHVQGENAIPEILGAFKYFEEDQEELNLDALVLLRGGGSLEDLQAFNSEKIARAVFSAPIPVLCGVGHEEDVTLAGVTADLRASTPSNAAELLVRQRSEIEEEVKNSLYKIKVSLGELLKEEKEKVQRFRRAAASFVRARKREAKNIYKQFQREFSFFEKKLKREQRKTRRFYTTALGFLAREQKKLDRKRKKLLQGIRELYQEAKRFSIHQRSLLSSYSPQSVLNRGYSIIRDKKGEIVQSTGNLNKGEELKIRLKEGKLKALIEEIFNS